jgi:predicted small lipoprotein YifL
MEGKVVRALVAAVLAVGLASCGSSGPLSRAEFTKQANAICKQRTADIEAARKQVHTRDFASIIVAALPVVEKAESKLAALKPPKELQTRYTQYVAGVRAQLAQIKRGLAAMRAHRRVPSETSNIGERQAQLVQQLGIQGCR